MADIDYVGYGDQPRITGAQFQRIVHVTGAVCSLALIAGVAFWGYRLAVRDVTGIPVIRAAEGPMRVAPDNPGGDIADHQGMSVNTVAALGGAGALPQEITLAPPPIDLAEEDGPGLAAPEPMAVVVARPPLPLAAGPGLAPSSAGEGLPEVQATPENPEIVAGTMPDALAADPLAVPLMPGQDAAPSTDDAVAMALAEALAGDLAPLLPLAPEAEGDPVAPDQTQGPAVTEDGILTRSPRPMARPSAGRVEDGASVFASVGPEIDPQTLAAGTRLVQLGAFDSPDLARGEWARLTGKFGDVMSGKSVVIQSAESGGRTFYRLRAHGFDGEDDARRFCAALLAEDAACIPVAHR